MKGTSQANLKDVLNNLKSTKITERREALSSFRTIFERSDFINNFHINAEGVVEPRAWLAVFQALFEAVLTEKLAATKKETSKSAGSTAAAQKRLEEAASTVRWLTERTVHLMNKRVTKPIFEHLLQTMVHRGELLTPVALHYIKALRCLVNFTPHLEHMDDDTWVRMVEMSFNNLLGDPIRSSFENDTVEASPAQEADDSDLFVADDPMNEDDVLPSTSRKRGRADSNVDPVSLKALSQTKHKIRTATHQVSVSHEQVEFNSLLSVLLRSPSSPTLSTEYPHLASSILMRQRRFLDLYTGDTSLLHDYIVALSSTLSNLSLNRTYDVAKFARESWDGLLGLWGTKNRRIKEGLVSILRILIPFVTSDNEAYNGVGTSFDCADSLSRLSAALEGEAESRWGVNGLSLDCLRLEVVDSQAQRPDSTGSSAFVARTFRFGWNFDSSQALAWAILELQADCIAKLFQLSEAIHPPSTPRLAFGDGKRLRLESPVASLLTKIQTRAASNVRAYHLQILLFVVDRHWLILHDTLQQEVIDILLQFTSLDDGAVQSWAFLCFATIASVVGSSSPRAEASTNPLKPRNEADTPWDAIWTSAIRRANVPTVSRAACHAAYLILHHTHAQKNGPAHLPLASTRVLFEIETLAKDLDVQGPPYPYDSVCTFLACCLKVASQDMHLYRMQLEEKVLSWLVDCWKVAGFRRKTLSLHMVSDLMLLLESICGLNHRSDLINRVPLPEGQIVETLVNEAKTKVIKDFVLAARLPQFQVSKETPWTDSLSSRSTVINSDRLAQPRGRERRISAFLLKSIERLLSDWDESTAPPSAETARLSLDTAVTALSFESALVFNGTQSDRRLIQRACKLIRIVTALLIDARWTAAEKTLISLGLDPLTFFGNDSGSERLWSAMLPPDIGSGIKAQTLSQLSNQGTNGDDKSRVSRMNFLRIIWQNVDVQSAFNDINNTLRDVLRVLLGDKPTVNAGPHGMDVDEHDEFGPIRTAAQQHSMSTIEPTVDLHSSHFVLDICISFLTVGPALQSASGEPTRDKDLTELVLNCAESRPEAFLLVFPMVLEKSQQRTLNLSVKSLDSFLNELSRLLQLYQYARSHRLQSLAAQLLSSTLEIWASPDVAIGETSDKVRQICDWLSGALRKKKIRSWVVRDFLARFFDKYLVKDPTEHAWILAEEQEANVEELPSSLLPMMGADDDMRVRFRVAVINARLFAFARHTGRPINDVYVAIKEQLTVHLENYEHMLTRILSLGNVMIMGSAVRRGAYWHLLETCLHTSLYSAHMEVVLRGVSERMGLVDPSSLFEAYASQLAYSIRQSKSDFLRFPPHLLGYKDRKECALANFRSFTPTNIWNGGQNLFESHCKVISKSFSDGLRICFGDILGYQIVTWIDEHDTATEGLGPLLRSKTFQGDEFAEHLAQNVDSIVVSILRTFGDQDVSETGPIVKVLRDIDQTGHSVATFRNLTRYRSAADFDTHLPNLPAFPAETVLQALQWLRSEASSMDEKATSYHILRQLFAEVDKSPLVNEQTRLINAICLWIAIHVQDFQDITLLHTLIHGATALLGQSDLARSAQSMLDWGFSCYRKVKTKHPRIPDILVRISCLAYDYSRSTLNPEIALMGIELLDWIDIQACKLSQVQPLSSQVMKALPAWPHQPSAQLAQLCESITGEHLSSVLGDHRIASSKFRLVRRLRDHALSKEYSQANFAQFDFWRLKECIPPSQQLQDADIDAFAGLLFLNKGHLDSFRSEASSSTSILNQHRRGLSRTSKNRVDSARESIILLLLAMVHGDSTSQSNAAYETLRLIKSVEAKEPSNVYVSSTEHSVELDYLEKYLRSPKEQTSRDINDLLASDIYLESLGYFPRWIAQMTTLLSEVLSAADGFYAQIIPILQSDTAFAEQVLPVLVYTVIANEQGSTSGHTVQHRTILSEYFTRALTSGLASVRCLRSVIDVVLHLRHFEFGQPRDPSKPLAYDALSYNKWLDIDFMLLARCSIICGAYTTALLFLELAAERRREFPLPSEASQSSGDSEVLYEIYRHIDEPDGFYGIHDSNLHQNLIKRFHHENQWERAFRFHGAALEAGDTFEHAEGLVKSFHSFGFDHLANDALRAGSSVKVQGNNKPSPGISFRLAWRTETWDLPESDEQSSGASLYLALRTIHRDRDERGVDATIQGCLFREMDRLRALGSENFAEIREVVQDIMCLHEIVKWRRDPIQACLKSKDLNPSNWDHFIGIDPDFEFSNLENIMAIRISLVRSARQKEQRQQIGALVGPFTQSLIDIENRCLVRLSKAARAANQVQIALNSVVRAQRLETIPTFAVFEEFASVLWCQKEEKMAVEFLDRLHLTGWTSHIRDKVSDYEKALLLARLGSWSSAACLKQPEDIQNDYFTAAANLLPNADGSSFPDSQAAQATVYHDCAIFAERQYYEILKSPDAIRWKIYVERKEQEVVTRGNELKRLVERTPAHTSLKNQQEKAEKLLKADTESFRKYNRARDAFLQQAIDMYSRSLEVSDAYDGDAGIRLCSLWFANFEETENGLQEHVGTALERVPSRKFVFLSHQLSARISNPLTGKLSASQRNLQSLVLRMCKEHPFHSLYQVYCLQPGRPISSSARRQSGRTFSPMIQTERSAAAGEIFDRLRADATTIERLLAIEQICDACVQWAKYPIKENKNYDSKKVMKLPKDVKIGNISNLRVPVMTHHTPIDATMQYNDCPWIDHYETDWTVAGGINLPKINTCVGTDGVKYKQLFKGEGEDDLRQDAVMEQVFGLVNGILRRDRETRRRLLDVRDYKVIPLASQAGLLEFVGNTLPLARWLINAHARYHPDDLPVRAMGVQLRELQDTHKADATEGLNNLVLNFVRLQKRVRPVMRHFFTEKHKTPISWFAMRLNYTRSVATTSIVGHILGLGDRHTSNILMDNASGQVVHIDLGIAFDQGKLLRVPELVPFRMTRDIIDGMGMSKTSGVFQRCAEETLRVLRDGSEVIMTVLEVFKHDPLHSWTASETKINRVQQGALTTMANTVRFGADIGIDMSSGGAEEAADRALSSVARKLDKSLSVQSAVTQLVREATDLRNLSQIYHGWYPLY